MWSIFLSRFFSGTRKWSDASVPAAKMALWMLCSWILCAAKVLECVFFRFRWEKFLLGSLDERFFLARELDDACSKGLWNWMLDICTVEVVEHAFWLFPRKVFFMGSFRHERFFTFLSWVIFCCQREMVLNLLLLFKFEGSYSVEVVVFFLLNSLRESFLGVHFDERMFYARMLIDGTDNWSLLEW